MNWNWYREESINTDTNLMDPRVIADYDRQMARLQDTKLEFDRFISLVEPRPDWVVADFGCGTGEFSIRLSRICQSVYALDVSRPMLEFAAVKAAVAGIRNIKFIQAGFLSWEQPSDPLDAAVSCMALHHLPDFWKIAALRSVNSRMKDGGILYLQDVVFSFPSGDYSRAFDNWVEQVGSAAPGLRKSAENHIRNEFSTTVGVMRSVIAESGFEIVYERRAGGFLGYFVCRKSPKNSGEGGV